MRVTKSLVFLITTLVMIFGGLSLTAPSASAGPLITGTGAIAEALAEVKILIDQVKTIQKTLAIINDRFENLEDGLHDLLAEAINRLSACDDVELPVCIHEVQLLLEQAQRDKAMILVVYIEEFLDFLHEFEVGLGEVAGKIGGLKEIGKIRVSDAMFMEVKLNSCNKIVTLIDSEAAELSALLEDGDDGEDPEDFDPETNGADDVNDFIALALKGLRGEEQLDFVIDALVNAQAVLDQAQAVKEDIHWKKVPACRTALKQVERVLKKYARINKVVPILTELGMTQAKVYTLGGQLVSVGSATALDRNSLANGVYVVAYSDGRVEKLVVLH